MKNLILLGITIQLTAAGLQAEYHGKMADLRIPAKDIGTKWEGPTGHVQEKGQASPIPPDLAAKVGNKLKGLPAAMADAMCSTPEGGNIQFQLFYYATNAMAKESYRKLAAAREKEGEYVAVKDFGDAAFDYKNFKKRFVLVDNMMVTVVQMPDGEEHLKLLRSYIDRIRNGDGKKTKP
jgi:hypothetical protein